MEKTTTLVTFVPQISPDVPWHTRQHIQLLYQKLNNHTQAFANLTKTAAGTTNNTIIENVTSGGGGGGGIITGLGGVNDQTGATTYTPTSTDNGIFLIFGDASPVTVTLNSAMVIPYFFFATNYGASNVTLTPTSGSIDNPTIPVGGLYLVAFDGTNWKVAALLASTINFADEEIPTGLINGTNVTYTLVHTPNPAGSLQLYLAGLQQWQNASGDYTLSGATITFALAPTLGPLLAWYRF